MMMSFNALPDPVLAESLQIEATDPAIPANIMTMSPDCPPGRISQTSSILAAQVYTAQLSSRDGMMVAPWWG